MQSDSPTPVVSLQDLSPFAPAKPPRELTARDRRAIWTEPRVRRWWLLASFILVLFAAYTATQLWSRQNEIKLIRTGQVVNATVLSAAELRPGAQISPSDLVQLALHFSNTSSPESVSGYLANPTSVGKDIKLHVDPADHTHWTDRTEATPLLDSLFVGLLVSPLVPLLFLLAFIKMRTMQKVWQTGNAMVAVVFDRKQSPIAPLAYSIRCSLQSGNDKKLLSVFVPKIGNGLARGDLVWVIMPTKSGLPLAGLWMGCGSVRA